MFAICEMYTAVYAELYFLFCLRNGPRHIVPVFLSYGFPPPGGLVGWLVEKVFCRRGFTLKCDFVAGAGVGDEVQISWVSRPQPRKTSAC